MGLGTEYCLSPVFAMMSGGVAANSLVMDADGEELAIKYWPTKTSPISDVTVFLNVTGDTTGINLRIRLESDSADAPSGTKLGATNNAVSAEFTLTASGFCTLQTLAENTGNLTLNVPVWIIVYRSSGNSLSGTNYFKLSGLTMGFISSQPTRTRLYTAGSWTGTTAVTQRGSAVVKHADNSYDGLPYTSSTVAPTAATDIYGDYSHGIRLKSGSQVIIRSAWIYLLKAGTPNALVVTVYEGATSKYSQTVLAANIITGVPMPIYFSNPVILAAETNLYLTLKQQSDGGTDANDYDSRVFPFSSTYREAAIPADYAFVYGAGNDPTAFTVSNTDLPMIFPVITDPATDLDQAAGGGGFPILGGSVVR